jgi:RHS repeat-associated protein
VGSENFDAWVDLNRAGDMTARRVYGGGFDEPLARQDGGGAVGWYAAERLGSVRVVFDNSGAVTAAADYTGFGAVTVTAGVLDRFRYTGREWDETIELQHSRARVYDPDTGRFLTEDPWRIAAGDPNLYRYAGNSPTNATDPSGLQKEPPRLVFGPNVASHNPAHHPGSNSGFSLSLLRPGDAPGDPLGGLPVAAPPGGGPPRAALPGGASWFTDDPKLRELYELVAAAQGRALPVYHGPAMTAVSPEQKQAERDLKWRAHLEWTRAQCNPGRTDINWDVIERQRLVERQETLERWGRKSEAEKYVLLTMDLVLWTIATAGLGPVGRAHGVRHGVRVSRVEPGVIRFEHAGRSVQFAEAELAAAAQKAQGAAPGAGAGNRAAVEALADSYRGSLKTGGPKTVAVLETPGGTFNGRSGFPGQPHPVAQQVLDGIPVGQRSLFHGGCAEVDAVSQALLAHEARTGQQITTVDQARQALAGSSVQTGRVRGPDSSQHGTPIVPCNSCDPFLAALGITYR